LKSIDKNICVRILKPIYDDLSDCVTDKMSAFKREIKLMMLGNNPIKVY